MSVSAIDARENRLKWLLRPLQWAGHVSWFGAILTAFMWLDRDITAGTIAIIATTALFVTFGFLFWATIRIQKAARGRF